MCGTAAIGSMLALGTAIRLDLARRWQGGGKAGVSANKLAERAFAPRSSGPGWARTWHGRADGTCLRLDEEPARAVHRLPPDGQRNAAESEWPLSDSVK